ncbi:recombinase family protein [Nocardioides sp. WG-D5]
MERRSSEPTAVAYARVAASTMLTSERSVELQLERCRSTAERLGARVLQEFVDQGVSAHANSKPGMEALYDFVEDHDVDYVVVLEVSRLGRTSSAGLSEVLQLQGYGAQVVLAESDAVLRVVTDDDVREAPDGTA